MRVFQVIGGSGSSYVPANRTWVHNLYEPLVEMGIEVVSFPLEEGQQAMRQNNRALRAQFSQKLMDTYRREAARQPFDLVFTYLMDGMVETAALDEMRRAGAPLCNFSCNNIHQFDLVDEISPHFDFNLHAERDAREKFLAIGAQALWWPMASNPTYFKPYPLERMLAVSFVGANYALRARYIDHLLCHGIDAHAYGPGWQHGSVSAWRSLGKRVKLLLGSALAPTAEARYRASANLADHDFRRLLARRYPRNLHPPVTDDELVQLYSRSQVSLGFLEVYEGHDASRPVTRHVHLREFEAPMSGALYCTGYSDELAGYFEPDREILMYRTPEEMLEKIQFYLAHPQEAEAIRQAGRRRALTDHTYRKRFEQLFNQLGLQVAR